MLVFLSGIVPESVLQKFEKVKYSGTHPIEAARDAIKRAIEKTKQEIPSFLLYTPRWV